MKILTEIKIGWLLIGINLTCGVLTALAGMWGYVLLHLGITIILVIANEIYEREEENK